MRKITTNLNTLFRQNNNIKYNVINTEIVDGVITYTFETITKHGLMDNSTVNLIKNFIDKYDENGILIEDTFSQREKEGLYTEMTQQEAKIKVLSPTTFSISFEEYLLIKCINSSLPEFNAVISLVDKEIIDIVNNNLNVIIKSGGKVYKGGRAEQTEELDRNPGFTIIYFDMPIPSIIEDGYVYVKNTWFMKTSDNIDLITFDSDNIEIKESGLFLDTVIPLTSTTEYKIYGNDVKCELYLKDIIDDVLPPIIDNEKCQFIPIIKSSLTNKGVQEIVFNLHFRKRYDFSKENKFSTDDDAVWNGFTINNGVLVRENTLTDGHADGLDKLGFTEDDIKFQKTKIKKSFIRLLFYSSPNFLEQELLTYTTIFFDTGELYQKYAQIINKKYAVFDDTQTNEEFRLSAKFSVRNKYDMSKSSEGFYLYLFPNEVPENEERTIYMKVEFNHAGYGERIPMILPRVKDSTGKESILLSTDSRFPKTMITVNENGMMDNNFEEYNDATMIPVNIAYDKKKQQYVYYFPWMHNSSSNGNKITLNLWEPRMRAIE